MRLESKNRVDLSACKMYRMKRRGGDTDEWMGWRGDLLVKEIVRIGDGEKRMMEMNGEMKEGIGVRGNDFIVCI